nr:hypothetical protein [Tanacetum cinerariifolium]
MSFRNFIYTEDDEDLAFLPSDFSLGFNIGSSSVSINIEPVRADEELAVEPTTDLRLSLERKCKTRGGSLRPFVKRKLASGSSTSCTVHAKASAIKDDTHVLSISDDDEAVMDNAMNMRSHKILEVIRKLRGETNVMKARELAREEEYEGLQAKCKVAMTDFDKNPVVNLSSWESKIASLEAEKANLKATEALLRQEIKEVKHDRREVVSKVVPYACMELLHGDELGRLVGKLVSSAITFEPMNRLQE